MPRKPYKQIRKECKHCLRIYYTMPSRNKVFCSGKCQKSWRKGKSLIEIYGDKAEMMLKILKRKKGIGERIEFICPRCNKKLLITPFRATRIKYCSTKCSNNSKGEVWNKGKKHTPTHRKNLRIARLNYISEVYNKGLPVHPNVGRFESTILNNLEKCFNYTIVRQFKIGGYFVDGYCPMLNLVIEIDERGHKYKKEKDIERQDFIQSELSCQFLRLLVEEV